MAQAHDEEWRNHFALTLSLADGPQARVFAINAGLRRFQPNYVHLYELKSFWYDRILSDQDMDYHAFSKIEAHPAKPLPAVDPLVRANAMVHVLLSCMDAHAPGFALRSAGWCKR